MPHNSGMPLRFASGIDANPLRGGFLLSATSAETSIGEFPLGTFEGLDRWSAQFRPDPYWMSHRAGTDLAEIPEEVQHLLIRRKNGKYVIVMPLINDNVRVSLKGSPNGIVAVAETGSSQVTETEIDLAFAMEGDDPFILRQLVAETVAAIVGIDSLRHEKTLPAFIDTFGWCTWDAFYQDVSHDKVREGLQSFKSGGIRPGYLILDDGWQTVSSGPTVHQSRLTSFQPNEKFGGDLAPTIAMAKTEFGIGSFIVWHAIQGYWAGVEMPQYQAPVVACDPSPAFRRSNPGYADWIPEVAAVVPEDIYRFFQDYHRTLRRMGVDGVKVDNQAALETIGENYGGRMNMMRSYREALEGSTSVHFAGALINCMSCSNDMLLQARTSNLVRTSPDFFPDKPETHGEHLVTNAFVGFGFGEFIHPDWDMFQSGHPMGAFHAAGRAVSGGPIYVSDKPGSHDFPLLKKLCLPDGRTVRALQPGLPTADCLMHDPVREAVALKVFNRNAENAVLGLFNCGSENALKTTFRPADLPGYEEGRYVIYLHGTDELFELDAEETREVALDPLGWEIATIAPLDEDAIGLIGLFSTLNPGGGIVAADPLPGLMALAVIGGGDILIYTDKRPKAVFVDGEKARADFSRKRLLIPVPAGEHEIEIEYR
ncbi:hypothetical protein EON81_02750 [bacterium]|nr:MAG: hypothetical protein EON81_02750 [bacterium]